MGDPIRSDEAHDRLTRIAGAMVDAAMEHPDYRDSDKLMAGVSDAEGGGIRLFGFDDDADALATIIQHGRALARSAGADLRLMTLGGDG